MPPHSQESFYANNIARGRASRPFAILPQAIEEPSEKGNRTDGNAGYHDYADHLFLPLISIYVKSTPSSKPSGRYLP